jgi:hypothetical protein
MDEEMIKIYFATHGLSLTDLERGFNLISSDKRKITPIGISSINLRCTQIRSKIFQAFA